MKTLLTCALFLMATMGVLLLNAPAVGQQPPTEDDVAAVGTLTVTGKSEANGTITVSGTSTTKAGFPSTTPGKVSIYAVNTTTKNAQYAQSANPPDAAGDWTATMAKPMGLGTYDIWAVTTFSNGSLTMDIGSPFTSLGVAQNTTVDPYSAQCAITIIPKRDQYGTRFTCAGTWSLRNPMPPTTDPVKFKFDPGWQVNLLCIPTKGGKVRQTNLVMGGTLVEYPRSGNIATQLAGLEVPNIKLYNTYTSLLVNDVANMKQFT